MFCKECGKVVEDDSKFCKNCGNSIISEQINNPNSSIKPVEVISERKIIKNNICCPLYNHIDNISKVSAVYSRGVSEGSYSGTAISYISPLSSNESSSIAITPVSMGGFSITDLSRRLAPPPKPMYPSNALFVIFLILSIISAPLVLLMGTGLALLAIFVPLTVWQGTKNSNKTKETKEYLPIYEKAIVRWNKLYYCFRDDIIFDPETNEYATADNISNLIYKDYYSDKAIRIDSENAGTGYSKDSALNNLEKYNKAIKYYDEAIKMNPEDADSWYNKGVALYKIGKYEEAIKCFDEAIRINPDYADAWYRKSLVLDKLGEYDEEIKCYEEAKRINPDIH